MVRPQHCPAPLYGLMSDCWHMQVSCSRLYTWRQAGERPPWARLVAALQQLQQDALPGVYLRLPPLQVMVSWRRQLEPQVATPPSSPGSSASSVFSLGRDAALGTTDLVRRLSEESGYQSLGEEEGS
jgi:hypothetical protein